MKFVICFFFFFVFHTTSFSQGLAEDSLEGSQLKHVIHLYDQRIDGNAPVYNGTAYLYFTFRMHGDPFFESGNLSSGWVSYKGIVYDPLSVMYDIYRNQVVILLPDSASRIVADNEYVDSFNVAQHTFINLKEDHRQNLYDAGFYDVLYRGHIRLLAKRVKQTSEVVEDKFFVKVFSEKDRFYLYKNGLYYYVNTPKDVLHLFNDKKRELKKLMRQQHLKFKRKNFESDLLKVVELYDQANH